MAFLLSLLACTGDEDYARLYHTEALAPSLDQDEVEDLQHLGPTLIDDGVNFGVYSERAERVDLLLFEDPEDAEPTQRFEMRRCGDVWNLYVEGIGVGTNYGYVAWGPNWPYDPDWIPGQLDGFVADVDSDGNRFNPNKLLTDPYALAMHREHDWGRASLGTGESRRQESTWGAASKSVVVRSDYTWSENEDFWIESRKADSLAGHGWNEQIVYEVHAKGFTANGIEGVDHPGTYRGFGEQAAYFAELGITAVELLPVHEKPSDGGYWGYNNISFFANNLGYSADRDNGEHAAVIDEFKWMVDQLHQHGIEVWVDVVYNHTGEGGLWRDKLYYNDYTEDGSAVEDAVHLDSVEVASLYNFRGLDNWSYYALDPGGLTYWNNTGVGNETRGNHEPMRKLIIDSLRYMVEELHVDGFRFDLAGILGEQDLNYNEWDDPANTVLQDIIDDPVLQEHNTRITAEPWTAGGHYNPVLGAFPHTSNGHPGGWGEWNGHFRDLWRSMINEDTSFGHYEGVLSMGGALTGSAEMYGWNDRKPWHSMNFVTVHDGFTMYDLVSFEEKQNGCGVLNPVCCDDPTSSWCETDSGESHNRSRDWGDEALKRQMMRNFFVGMLVSHGTPLLYGGDEWMRTQYGNNNAYSTWADNEWNWFRWGEWQAYDERHRMFDFVKKMIAFRKAHIDKLSPYEHGGEFAWKDAYNNDATDWSVRHMAVHHYGGDTQLEILMNFEDGDVTFTLPEDVEWVRVVDTQAWFDKGDAEDEDGWFAENDDLDTRETQNIWPEGGDVIEDAEYTVPSKTIVILEGS